MLETGDLFKPWRGDRVEHLAGRVVERRRLLTFTFAAFSVAQPPVSPLWKVNRSEMKFTP